MVVPAQFKYILLIILFALGSVNFTRTALEIINNSKRLDHLNDEVATLRQQKASLEEKVAYKKTDAFVEEVARNDLNMIKPGEKVFILDIPEVKATEVVPAQPVFKGSDKPVEFGGSVHPLDAWVRLYNRP